MPELRERAYDYYDPQLDDGKSAEGDITKTMKSKDPGAILRWVRKYEREGLAGLLDNYGNRGNRQRRMTPTELSLLVSEVQKYLSDQKPTIQQIHRNVKMAFREENIRREAEGLPHLNVPSRETVRKEIKKLNRFHVDLAREGKQRALQKHAPIGQGLRLTRLLERVEMDEWKIDLMSLLSAAGLTEYLTEEEKQAIGLDDVKARWWISVAICCTSRCVLALRLMREPSVASALATIEMAVSDKGIFTDAVAARTPWNIFGGIEHLVTDCGPAFRSKEFAVAMSDLGINRFELAIAGVPQLRHSIERLFDTFATQLMPLLRGRTFSDVVSKGDYDPAKNAVLTADELATALVRYVVDFYHNAPHEGLNGETPFNCWQRLAREGTLRPAPDRRRRRIVFGTTLTKKVQRTGIRILNVFYHSPELASWMARNGSSEVQVRWHQQDIGEIEVCLDGVWQNVGAVQDEFRGVSAQSWTAAMRSLRRANAEAAEMAEETVFAAIRDIEAMNANAIKRGNLIVDTWTPERLADYEDRLFVGFNVAQRSDEPAPAPTSRFGTRINAATPTFTPASPRSRLSAPEAPQNPTQSPSDAGGFTIKDE